MRVWWNSSDHQCLYWPLFSSLQEWGLDCSLQNGESQLQSLLFFLWISFLWALGSRDGYVTAWVTRKYQKCDSIARWKQVSVDKSCIFSNFIAKEREHCSTPFPCPSTSIQTHLCSVVGRIMIILHNVFISVLNLLCLIGANSSKLPWSCSLKLRKIVNNRNVTKKNNSVFLVPRALKSRRAFYPAFLTTLQLASCSVMCWWH